MKYHAPVLSQEVTEFLRVESEGKYIDCTLGDGGHTAEILKRGGSVLGIDVDKDSLNRATERIEQIGLKKKFKGVRGNFKDVDTIAKENGFDEVNGIIYDLGLNSSQLESGTKGLSFQRDARLDMRMDSDLGVTASDLVNALSEKELTHLFGEYGEERLAKRFAKAIVKVRSLKKLETTKQLADLISAQASPGYERGRIHPATRVFQALRIAVNGELDNLSVSLPKAACLLLSPQNDNERNLSLPGGRMVIISFHSLEDRLVKEFGRNTRLVKIISQPVMAGTEETQENRRARSAKMRVFERENTKC